MGKDNKKTNDKKISKKTYVIIGVIVILVALDQILKVLVINNIETSKVIINGFLSFTYVENKGGAFGVGQNNLGTFIITNVIVIGVIIHFMIAQKDRTDKKTVSALCLILAGGISNFIDRIFRGSVIDYLDITQLFKFPVFNLADIFIVLGWITLIICIIKFSLFELKNNKNKREN